MAKTIIEIIQIYPSLLAANALELGEQIKHLENAGIQTLHLDVMDNHYVPNLSFGPHIAKQIKNAFPKMKLDVHLMVTPVDALIEAFAKAGVHSISIHPDATYHLDRSLNLIRSYGCRAGIALNPATPIETITWCEHLLDFALIMTVNPGFGGQKMIPAVIPKIKQLAQKYPHLEIAVDGGVDATQIQTLQKAGAQRFIVGSALFEAHDYSKRLNELCGL